MAGSGGEYPEVFTLSELPDFQKETRTVYPPRADIHGRFKISELMDWFDLMDQAYRHNSLGCDLFRSQLVSMSTEDAQRAQARIREIERLMPKFTRRHPGLIPEQQRVKDLCAMLFVELNLYAGQIDCLKLFSQYIAGSADKWQSFSSALVDNNLSGQKDWRQARSPAKWMKTATNNRAAKDYWVPMYAVDPSEGKDFVSLEEIAELPGEAMLERKFTQRSVAELEKAAKDDLEVKEFIAAKIRYPDWRREDVWRLLGWDDDRGGRVDRRYRRLRARLRDLGAGIQCRDYRPPAGISDANCTAYFEPLFDGCFGRKTGVWQHRDPYRDEDGM